MATLEEFPQVSDGRDFSEQLRWLPPRPRTAATRRRVAAIAGITYVASKCGGAYGKTPNMAVRQMSLSDSTPQKMYDALKKQPIAVMARTWRSDGCAPRPVLGGAAGRAGFRTILQVMGLSLLA